MEPDVTALTRVRQRLGAGPPRPDAATASTPSPRRGETSDADSAVAVGALYADHALGLTRLAYIMLGSRAAAEDVVQDAFCGLYRRWPHLSDRAKALGYARSSVLNGCRSVLRRRVTLELDEAGDMSTGSAESALLTEEARREVLTALRRLPDRQREVLTLRFYLDLTDQEIAAAMGIGPSTVRSAAHRGLASLRRALKET